jgi:hypothetical protein
MKIRTALSLVSLCLAGFAPVHDAAARAGQPPPQMAPTIYPVVVSFISLGSGVPWFSVAPFNVAVNEYDQMYGTMERTIVHWGREGEFDVCFTLRGQLSAQARADFIEQMVAFGDADPNIITTQNDRCGP